MSILNNKIVITDLIKNKSVNKDNFKTENINEIFSKFKKIKTNMDNIIVEIFDFNFNKQNYYKLVCKTNEVTTLSFTDFFINRIFKKFYPKHKFCWSTENVIIRTDSEYSEDENTQENVIKIYSSDKAYGASYTSFNIFDFTNQKNITYIDMMQNYNIENMILKPNNLVYNEFDAELYKKLSENIMFIFSEFDNELYKKLSENIMFIFNEYNIKIDKIIFITYND